MYSIDEKAIAFLLEELAIAKGSDLDKVVVSKLRSLFSEMGEQVARKIVYEITSLDFVPRNLPGAVRTRFSEITAKNAYDPKKYFTPVADRITPEEYAALKKKISKIGKPLV